MNYKNVLRISSVYNLLKNLFNDILECWSDESGSLFFNVEPDYSKYMKLEIDYSVKSISKDDLPKEFCDKACQEIDVFRRKTVNEMNEWMLYIDYETGEILEYIKGISGEVVGEIFKSEFKGRKVVSIHNHPKDYLSAPSYDNFEILKYDFEDYEIICSENEFWILEAKGRSNKRIREKISNDIKSIYDKSLELSKQLSNGEDSYNLQNDIYTELLQNYLNDYSLINLINMGYK